MDDSLEKAFRKLGIDYETCYYILEDWECDEVFSEKIRKLLNLGNYNKVFSVNFVPLISNECERLGIPYVSWIYDSPVHIRDISPMRNTCNFIYCFDREQVERFQKANIQATYLPLAVDSEEMQARFSGSEFPQMQVSMVGQLYETEYSYFISPLDPYYQGYLEAAINAQMKLYGAYVIDKMITPEFLAGMNQQYAHIAIDGFQMGSRELEYLLAQEVTGRERFLALALLSKFFQVHLFAQKKNENLSNVLFHGYVDYKTQMPQVFANTLINLNISLKTIQSGIPLRVLDIMGCGGFVLSNYQIELGEYFRIGQECETYESLEELAEKTGYYLKNDSIRQKISRQGLEKVKKYFTFEERVWQMLGLK